MLPVGGSGGADQELAMMLRRAIVVLASSTLAVSFALPAARGAASAKLTAVDRVYALSEHTLGRLGVYHLTTRVLTTTGASTSVTRIEQWVDVHLGVSRTLTTFPVSAGTPKGHNTFVQLLAGHVRWSNGQPGSPSTCHHVNPAASDVLGCPFSEGKDDTAVQHGLYHGQPALVLVRHLVGGGEDALTRTTSRTYVDPATGLPLANVEIGTRTQTTTVALRITRSYRSERLPRSRLPKDFFSPASLGWKAPNPLDGLPHGVPVYWVGRTWAPGGRLPAITLQSVQRLPVSGHPEYDEILEYAPASDPYGPVILSLQLWTAKNWTAADLRWGIPACKPTSHVSVTLGVAALHCPTDKVDGPVADVGAPGAHVLVDAPSFGAAGVVTHSPYASIPALVRVLNSLRVRP